MTPECGEPMGTRFTIVLGLGKHVLYCKLKSYLSGVSVGYKGSREVN